MNNLQIFNNAQFGEIRTIDENGTVLFCGSDIAKALGYSNTKDALARHCKEDGVVFHDLIDNMGREQHAKFINEGNVYRLITHSKLPAAEQFESWVFDEVLPTIRRNGAYMTDDIVPLKVDYDRRLDNDNLITLCRYHHEAAERGRISRQELATMTCTVDFSRHNI